MIDRAFLALSGAFAPQTTPPAVPTPAPPAIVRPAAEPSAPRPVAKTAAPPDPPRPMVWQLADRSGVVWQNADLGQLRRDVAARDAQIPAPVVLAPPAFRYFAAPTRCGPTGCR